MRVLVPNGFQAWGVSHCRIDADGIRCEWVEACVATPGQPTIVHLHGGGTGGGSLKTRPPAAELAIATGARVLSVECATAADAVTAYAWLLGEGLDVDTTTFVGAPAGEGLPAVRRAMEELGLPLPHTTWTQKQHGHHRIKEYFEMQRASKEACR